MQVCIDCDIKNIFNYKKNLCIESQNSLNFRLSKENFGGVLKNGTWSGILKLFEDKV